jgi:hypothetical protein
MAAFFLAKMTPAQENYPIHKQELLAGVETMWRHCDILQGVHFTWIIDHKDLIHLMSQKDLSGQQARWLEKLGKFDFVIQYILGEENIFPDTLLRIYTDNAPGLVHHESEFLFCDMEGMHPAPLSHAIIAMPVLVGEEGCWSSLRLRSNALTWLKKVPAAETRCPETGQEFAWRMVTYGHFVLHGPRKQKEGKGVNSPPKPAALHLDAIAQQ